MKKYFKAISLLKEDLFQTPHTDEEILAALEGADRETYLVPYFKENQSMFLYNLLDSKIMLIVDERELAEVNPRDYELGGSREEFYNIIKLRYNQEGMLIRDKSFTQESMYADYDRIKEMLSNTYLSAVIPILEDIVVIVVMQKDTVLQIDSAINSIFSLINNFQVMYVVDNERGCYVAESANKSLLHILNNILGSDLPFFLKLQYSNFYNRTCNGIFFKKYGGIEGLYHKALPAKVKSVNYPIIKAYKLKDVDSLLSIDMQTDATSKDQWVNISMSSTVLNLKPNISGIPVECGRLNCTDFITGVLRSSDKTNKLLSSVCSRDSKPNSMININGSYVAMKEIFMRTAIIHEILQQYCNILSELYYNGKKQVILVDLAIIDYRGEQYVCVEPQDSSIRKMLDVFYVSSDYSGEIFSKRMEFKQEPSPVIYLNSPYFTGDSKFEYFTDEEKGTLTKIVYNALTEFTRYATNPVNIPSLGFFMIEGDDTFSSVDSISAGDTDKRKQLLYLAKVLDNSLRLKDYPQIPRTYNEAYINCFGGISSTYSPSFSGQRGRILLDV